MNKVFYQLLNAYDYSDRWTNRETVILCIVITIIIGTIIEAYAQ